MRRLTGNTRQVHKRARETWAGITRGRNGRDPPAMGFIEDMFASDLDSNIRDRSSSRLTVSICENEIRWRLDADDEEKGLIEKYKPESYSSSQPRYTAGSHLSKWTSDDKPQIIALGTLDEEPRMPIGDVSVEEAVGTSSLQHMLQIKRMKEIAEDRMD